jgi:hypothetical protein
MQGIAHPLIPLENLPVSCRIHRCVFEIHSNGVIRDANGAVTFNALQMGGTVLVHCRRTAERDQLVIPEEKLLDASVCIWGDFVKPWLEQLHQESPVHGYVTAMKIEDGELWATLRDGTTIHRREVDGAWRDVE